MKAFVIFIEEDNYSEHCSERCVQSAKKVGLIVEKFPGVSKLQANEIMASYNLKWTWANNNTKSGICPITKLNQFPYKTSDLRSKIGCFMSHYLLWEKCVALREKILILEHDAVFLRPLPDFEFQGICQINDPQGATRKGDWWSNTMKNRGREGVFEKTWVTTEKERSIPDGLAGNSAYIIRPHAAQELVAKVHQIGVWPNDAIMCKQLFPYLEEYYPFITKVVQTKSTTT